MPPQSLYQHVSPSIDLEAALVSASRRNDLLPPRPDDDVGGNVGKRFSEALKRDLASGSYEPDRVHFVSVPKSRHATRPAALMRLSDRVVYFALIEPLRLRVEKGLLPASITMWPRGMISDKNWDAFERAPITPRVTPTTHIVRADIAGFYESIDHRRLGDALVTLTGRGEIAAALVEFLGRAMGTSRGIPQGLEASDVLATSYLSVVDHQMIRSGHDYVRNGDDMRVSCASYSDARRALLELEAIVRSVDLQLSPAKSAIMKSASYERGLGAVDEILQMVLDTARKETVAGMVQANDGSVERALSDNNLIELGWNFFYFHRVSLEDFIKKLSEVIKPTDVSIASKLFEETYARRPGSGDLDGETFHALITKSLVQLSAGRSNVAIHACAELFLNFPDKTQLVAQYLLGLAATEPSGVALEMTKVFDAHEYHTPWETAWHLRVLLKLPNVDEVLIAHTYRIATDEGQPWLSRVEAAKVLARSHRLTPVVARRLWSRCPSVFRADLIQALLLEAASDWRDAFLGTAKTDPVYNVVIAHHGG